MKTCPGCSKSIADVMGQCPFCRHIFPAEEGAKPVIDPALIAAALAAESTHGTVRLSLAQAALLALALPVVVPSLIWCWIGAKRWGRVDWLFLALTGLVVTAFSLHSTLLLTLTLIADVAAAALFVMRYEKLDHGIFLGYSNAIAMLLILGGLLFGGALTLGLPFGALVSTLNLYALELPVRPSEFVKDALPPAPAPVRLEQPRIGEDGIYEKTPTGFALRGGTGRELADPGILWRQRDEFAGRPVHLSNPTAAWQTFEPGLLDSSGRAVGVLDGTEGRVWIAAETRDALKQEAPRAGILRIVNTNTNLARAWTKLGLKLPMPFMIVLLEPVTGPPPDPAAETYVAVHGSEGRAWLKFPFGFTGELPASVHGVLEPTWPVPPFVAHREQQPGRAGLARVIAVGSRTTYLARSPLGRALREGVTAGGMLALALGACLMAGGVLCAVRE